MTQSAGFGIVKFHRVRSITAQDGVLRCVNGDGFSPAGASNRNGDGSGDRIDGAHQSANTPLLPILAFLLLLGFHVGTFHGDNARGRKGFGVVGRLSTDQNPVADLEIR